MSTSEKQSKRPMFEQQPRERTFEEQAILSNAMSPPTPMTEASLSPVEEAGVQLARAMRRRHESWQYVSLQKAQLVKAEAELEAAERALVNARTYLAELVEGSP